MTTHCSQKLVCHNVIRSLFMSTVKQIWRQDRAMSTSVMTATKPVHTTTPSLYEYNKLLISHAKTFKNSSVQVQLDAAAILEEMRRNDVRPNSQSYIQLIIGLGWKPRRSLKQHERLEGWFNDFLSQLNAEQNKRPIPKVKKVMQCLSSRGHPHMKQMFLRSCQVYDNLGADCWNAAIEGCIKARELKDAEELLELARKKNIATTASYELLIEAFLRSRDQQSASKIFSYMIHDQITASGTLYQKFIEYYISLPSTTETSEALEKLWQALLMTTDDNIPDKTIENLLDYSSSNEKLSIAEQIILDLKSRKQRLNRVNLGLAFKVITQFANKRQLLSALSIYYDLIAEGYEPSSRVTSKLIKTAKLMKDEESGQQLMKIILEINQHDDSSKS